ncbi:hypothetical protein J4217_00035 [Candidatus Pacearchaeota archaeon]|nr:hypothetical protein [Candidatus Pacearchaeota archaeon]
MNKKGLSDIITTILIILLALAAIVLIWGFIKRPVEQGGQSIEKSADCLALSLKPTACVVRGTDTLGGSLVNATVQWADGDVDLQQIKVIITDSAGTNNVFNATAPPKLATTNITNGVTRGLGVAPYTLTAAGVIKTKTGVIGTCAESQDKLGCTYVAYVAP